MEINQVKMSNWRFGIVVVVLIGKPPLMGEVLCSTENSPFLIIDHIHAKINRVCCAALAKGKNCMNVRKNKLLRNEPYKKCFKQILLCVNMFSSKIIKTVHSNRLVTNATELNIIQISYVFRCHTIVVPFCIYTYN